MRLVGCLTMLALVAWSGINWLAWWVVDAGEAAVAQLSRWLGIDPSSTQWLGELFALASGVAQLMIALVWLAGVIAIGMLAWMGSQVAMVDVGKPDRQGGPVIEGEVRDRSLD